MNFTGSQIKREPIVFDDSIAAGAKTTYERELTGNGSITKVVVNFPTGTNGLLRVRPYVILNGNITQELINYGAAHYLSGDSEKLELDCFQPIETHAKLCVEVDNQRSGVSILDCIVIVEYEDYIKETSIVGFNGRNL